MKKTSATFSGTGKAGPFNEPGGLTILGDTLYVADTNHHEIRTVDLKTKAVGSLQLSNLEKLKPASMGEEFRGRLVELPSQKIKQGPATVTVNVRLPRGYKFTEGAPFTIDWKAGDEKVLHFKKSKEAKKVSFPYPIEVTASPGASDLAIDTTVYYCTEQSSRCFFDPIRIKTRLEVTSDASASASLETEVQIPKG